MSLLSVLFRRKQTEIAFDPNPGEVDYMPARPYRVLQAGLSFFSDPECRIEVPDACLIVLRCEDPRQKQETTECVPTMKLYRKGQLVLWEINHKRQWEAAWYIDPDTGKHEKAWALSVEFIGKVVSEKAAASAGESGSR